MILATDGLLDEGLVHLLAVNADCVVAIHREVGRRPRLVDADAQALLDLVGDALVQLRATIAVALEPSRRRDADLVEDLEDDPAVPEDLLEREVVDADRSPQLDVRDCGRGSRPVRCRF